MVLESKNGQYDWHLAPAYDLTLCTEGYNGEHATSANGTGHPTLNDLIAVGTKNKMSVQRCREIYDEVRSNCSDLLLCEIKAS
jgi:serine/threonine-protein kinase HipA